MKYSEIGRKGQPAGRGSAAGREWRARVAVAERWLILAVLMVVAGSGIQVRAERPPIPEEMLERCRQNPAVLRNDGTYRDLGKYDPAAGAMVFDAIFADDAQPWDVRVRALLLLPVEAAPEHYQRLGRDFSARQAARTGDGAAAVNFMARQVFGQDRRAEMMRSLLLPGPAMQGVAEILTSLSGQACHDYLHMLHAHDYPFSPSEIRRLAVTSDEATRRFVYWYAGRAGMSDLAGFLAGEIASAKPSTYGGRWMRLVLMAFTAGVSELMRAALPPPEWLDEDKTTKEVALGSLSRVVPVGAPMEAAVVQTLLDAALESAASDEEEDYRLAAALLLFLHERSVALAPGGKDALAALGRLVPDQDARNETFVLAVKVHRLTGLPLPPYRLEEIAGFWDRALRTLNAGYLAAVVSVWPDSPRRNELAAQLLQLGDEAARGNLRFPAKNETWLCVHDAGDWSRCVAGLKLEAALPALAGVLQTSWADDAAEALMAFGPAGQPPLREFIVTARAGELMGDERRECLRFCFDGLSAMEGAALARALLDNPPTRQLVRKVLQDMGPAGAEMLALLEERR